MAKRPGLLCLMQKGLYGIKEEKENEKNKQTNKTKTKQNLASLQTFQDIDHFQIHE